ncbi:Glutamyl-tRNA synthetase [Burkholderia cenocepacia PC184]|nr:Glutamyl-tRNA synthetase [Burkholderia cenocepacia PC184]
MAAGYTARGGDRFRAAAQRVACGRRRAGWRPRRAHHKASGALGAMSGASIIPASFPFRAPPAPLLSGLPRRPASNHSCAPGVRVTVYDPSCPYPLRAESHRLHPPRQHSLRTLSVGVRPQDERHVRAAHRGYRRRALVAGSGRCDPRGDAVARAGFRRRPDLPDAADGPLSRSARANAREESRISVLHVGRGTRRAARTPARSRPEAALRRYVASGARQGAAGAAGRREAGAALPQSADGHGRVGRCGEGACRDLERGARRPRDRAPGRHADLQLLRGGGRHGHGHHARDPR